MSGKICNGVFRTGVNQQIDAMIKLVDEQRSCIFGTVFDSSGEVVPDAVVKLLQIVSGYDYPIPITHTFTDDNGQFLLGPLCPNTTYMLKIFSDNTEIVNKCIKVTSFDGDCLNANNQCDCD